MFLHKLYQLKRHGFIGQSTQIRNKFQSVIPEPQFLKQVHSGNQVIIGIYTLPLGAEYYSHAVLPGYRFHELRLTAVRTVYRQETGYILLIMQAAQ